MSYRRSWPFKDSAPDFRSDVKNSLLPESHVWNDENTETLRKMSCSWLPSALLWFQLATVISLWLCWQTKVIGTIPFWIPVTLPVWLIPYSAPAGVERHGSSAIAVTRVQAAWSEWPWAGVM